MMFTAGLHHDGHRHSNEKVNNYNAKCNVQLRSFNILGLISPSWSSWFVAVIVELFTLHVLHVTLSAANL